MILCEDKFEYRDLQVKPGELFGPVSYTHLVILVARPGMGKTSFALNIATRVAMQQKVPVAIFSLEMTKEQLTNRIL